MARARLHSRRWGATHEVRQHVVEARRPAVALCEAGGLLPILRGPFLNRFQRQGLAMTANCRLPALVVPPHHAIVNCRGGPYQMAAVELDDRELVVEPDQQGVG